MTAEPVLQALILADHIYQDKETGKKVIAGTFSQLWSAQFPNTFGRATYAYVCLTGLHGQTDLCLRYRDLRTHEVLLESPHIQLNCSDPLQSIELIIVVPPFPMPHEGVYAFELHASGRMLGSVRISVGKREDHRNAR